MCVFAHCDFCSVDGQVIKMLVVIIIVFFICWGPQLIINTMKRLPVNVYDRHSYHVSVSTSLDKACYTTIYFTVLQVNPFILAILKAC